MLHSTYRAKKEAPELIDCDMSWSENLGRYKPWGEHIPLLVQAG